MNVVPASLESEYNNPTKIHDYLIKLKLTQKQTVDENSDENNESDNNSDSFHTDSSFGEMVQMLDDKEINSLLS